MKLTGEQHAQLQQALLNAFPIYDELAQMVRHQFGPNLAQIAGGGNLSGVVFNLINWAEAEGYDIKDFVAKARNERPGNPDLKTFAEQLDQATTAKSTPPTPSEQPKIGKSTPPTPLKGKRWVKVKIRVVLSVIVGVLVVACAIIWARPGIRFLLFPSATLTPPSNTRPPLAPTTPAPTTPSPSIDTPALTVSPTLTVTVEPLVRLTAPEDDSCLNCGSAITLCWIYSDTLLESEYYQLMVKVKEQDSLTLYSTKDDHYHFDSLSPGEYKWAVSVVRSIIADTYEPVSKESSWRRFHVLPPAPVVHSISPTSTLKDKAETVIVSGENFTAPVTLTVGSPLQATLLDSGTIMAIIPTTLRVGVYTVTVQDSMGRGVSSTVFFTVAEPPTPTPAVPPTRVPPTRTPPPALPGITLISPISNVHVGRSAQMTWKWPGSWEALGPDAVFAIRWGLVSEGEPSSAVWCTLVERPDEQWCPRSPEGLIKWPADFQDCNETGERSMVWNVALALADWEARSYKPLLVWSAPGYFRVQTDINKCRPD
jgi:hypothetical protein